MKRAKWGELAIGDVFGIRGGIDYNGVVVAHEYIWGHSDTNIHTVEELACGSTFCWSIPDQDFEQNRRPHPRNFTDDELMTIDNWLVDRGYKDE